MAIATTLNEWINNLCKQSVEAGIMDAISAAQIQNNIIGSTGLIQAITNTSEWIENSTFKNYNIIGLNNCNYFFNWYNLDDFLNSYKASNVFIGLISSGAAIPKKGLKTYGDIVFYYGTTTGGSSASIVNKNSVLGFKSYYEELNTWKESRGSYFLQANTTGQESLRIGFITPLGDNTYNYDIKRPLFKNEINYGQVDKSIPLTKNIKHINVYAAMDSEGTYYENFFQIADDIEPGVFHAFKIFKKSQFDAMLTLFGIKSYYRKPSDIDNNIDPVTPGEDISSDEIPPGQEKNEVDNQFGKGNFKSDVIDYPVNSVLGSGVGMSTYILTGEQLKLVLSKVWDPSLIEILTSFDLSPIVNALIWPCDMSSTREGATITSAGVYIGKTPIPFNTLDPALCHLITNKYLMIKDFGVIKIGQKEFFGSFMDFEPYTSASIYLPYYGTVPIPMSDIIGHDVSVKLCLDASTGAGKYLIFIDNIAKYNFDAQVGIQIQLTNSNFSETLQALMTNSVSQIMQAPKAAGSIVSDGVGNALGSMNSFDISTVSSSGNNNERLNSQQVYFVFERVETAIPEGFNKNFGRPSMITTKLSELKGFTTVLNPDIETSATDSEQEQIKSQLQEGVFIL